MFKGSSTGLIDKFLRLKWHVTDALLTLSCQARFAPLHISASAAERAEFIRHEERSDTSNWGDTIFAFRLSRSNSFMMSCMLSFLPCSKTVFYSWKECSIGWEHTSQINSMTSYLHMMNELNNLGLCEIQRYTTCLRHCVTSSRRKRESTSDTIVWRSKSAPNKYNISTARGSFK